MKIVVVATHPIQHFCPQYASLAAADGVDLTVVFDSLHGVETYRDPGFGRDVSWGARLLEGYRSIHLEGRSLADELNNLNPDWLVVYGYFSPIARRAWAWALAHPRVRVAYIADSEFRNAAPRSFAARCKRGILTLLFRRANAFLTVGNANEDYYRAHRVAESKMVRMHFPVDPTLLVDGAGGHTLREEWGIAPSALVILNVGKFEPWKRQADLIRATADVDGVHLVLVGTGAELDACREIALGRDDVTFAGFVPPSDLGSYYAMADVYAHPSTYDPHPLAVSEAAAAGCACVVSDRIGSWGSTDDVIPGESGMTYPATDTRALAHALRELEADRGRTAALGAVAQRHSQQYQERAHGGFLADLALLS